MEIMIVTMSLLNHGQRHSDLSFGFALSKSRRLSRTKQRSFSIKTVSFLEFSCTVYYTTQREMVGAHFDKKEGM